MNKNIVELYKLEFEGLVFFAGVDLATREIRFYTEADGIISQATESLCQQIIKYNEKSSEVLNPNFKIMLDNAIKLCKDYNNERGYSNLTLEKNLSNLTISSRVSSLELSQAHYDVFNNEFLFELPDSVWESRGLTSIMMQNTINQIISHEVGHMSVSDIKVGDDTVVGSIGFLQMRIPIKSSFRTSDGDNYYRIDREQKIKENGGRGLEELFNELENDEKTKNATAPQFAYRLNMLTEGKLGLARRNHSIADYAEIMESIIPNKENALLLLMQIELYYKAVGSRDEQSIKTMELDITSTLMDYEIKKHNMQSNSQKK